jgi:CheY-like chemotaxis protein
MLSTPELVSRIREATGDTQEGLARRLGVSFPTVNSWERGRSKPRSSHRQELEELAGSLGISHDLVVLVIDDDPIVVELVRAAATDLDPAITVNSASNGWEGLLECGVRRPRLLFLDIMMPGIDGLDVARRLPTISSLDDLTVVFVTASQSPDVLTEAAAIGNAVLAKPFELDELAAIMSDTLQGIPVA